MQALLSRRKPTSIHGFRQIFLFKASRKYQNKSLSKQKDDLQQWNPREERETDFDFQLIKSKGQHLLTNARILDKIVNVSDLRPDDSVLEIGPGTGNLTLKLLEAADKVIAVEIDRRMVEVLEKRVTARGFQDKLRVIYGDALKSKFPPFDIVVANIPYGISSPLIIKLVHGLNPFRSATLLLQKEFARRLLACPGDPEFNRLAVNIKLVANVEHVLDVSKRDFLPPPKIDSSVVIIRPKSEVPNVNLVEWRAFTRVLFSNKNKTLGASFKQKRRVQQLLNISKGMDSGNQSNADFDFDERDEGEEADSCTSSSCSELEINLFKEMIAQTLREHKFECKRPSKMCIQEMITLLFVFNQRGICFS